MREGCIFSYLFYNFTEKNRNASMPPAFLRPISSKTLTCSKKCTTLAGNRRRPKTTAAPAASPSFNAFPSLDALPLSMLDLSQCFTSFCALPFSLLYQFLCFFPFQCFTSLEESPLSMLYLFLCVHLFPSVTSLNSLFLSVLYLSQFFTSLIASPLSILYLSHCFTSLIALPVSVLYLFLYFTSFKVVLRMTEVLTNFL